MDIAPPGWWDDDDGELLLQASQQFEDDAEQHSQLHPTDSEAALPATTLLTDLEDELFLQAS